MESVMSKRKPRPVVPPIDDTKLFTITIDPKEVEGKVRKPLPPATQRHRNKTKYRRKPKHPGGEDES